MQLKFMAADIGTENGKGRSYAGLAIRKMTEMRDRGALAFIGPDDTCGSEALVASAWDLPIISYVSWLSSFKKLENLRVSRVNELAGGINDVDAN